MTITSLVFLVKLIGKGNQSDRFLEVTDTRKIQVVTGVSAVINVIYSRFIWHIKKKNEKSNDMTLLAEIIMQRACFKLLQVRCNDNAELPMPRSGG